MNLGYKLIDIIFRGLHSDMQLSQLRLDLAPMRSQLRYSLLNQYIGPDFDTHHLYV